MRDGREVRGGEGYVEGAGSVSWLEKKEGTGTGDAQSAGKLLSSTFFRHAERFSWAMRPGVSTFAWIWHSPRFRDGGVFGDVVGAACQNSPPPQTIFGLVTMELWLRSPAVIMHHHCVVPAKTNDSSMSFCCAIAFFFYPP